MATLTISASTLTQAVRDEVVDGGWQRGLQILMESLGGMTRGIAQTVLSGHKRLVNTPEGMDLVDEDPDVLAEHTEEVNGTYLGRYYDRGSGRWFTPYAYITEPGARGYNLPTDPLERDPEKERLPKDMRHLPAEEVVRRQSEEWAEREEANEMLRDLTR